MKRRWIPLLVLCLVACRSSDPRQVRVRALSLAIDGSLRSGSPRSNSIDALGLERDDFVPQAEAIWRHGPWRFALTALTSEHDGQGRLEEDLVDGNFTLPQGAAVDSSFDQELFTFAGTWDLSKRADTDLGVGLGVAFASLEAAVTALDNSGRVFTDESAFFPFVALRAERFFAGRWELGLDLRAMAGDFGGDRAHFVDGELALGCWLLDSANGRVHGWLELGWRAIGTGLSYREGGDDVEARLQWSGPFLGCRVAF